MRIGVFGGTFDPVHIGHLIIAEQAREQAQLDRVLFVPSARPPHKLDEKITAFDRRLEMLQLALAGQTHLQIDTMERDRHGPSYTADTLSAIHALHPDDELFLILGGDCLVDLPRWYEPLRIIDLATLLFAIRPGWTELAREDLARALGQSDESRIKVQGLEMPLIHIASRDLRMRANQNRSLRYLVPHAVEVYIREKKLYRSSQPNNSN